MRQLGLKVMGVLASSMLLVSAVRSEPNSENGFRFVAVGDMPYSAAETKALQGTIKTAIAEADVPFVVHFGDIKAGNESCTDERIQQARDDIYALHTQVFFTPGDNDWTDCDRPKLTQPKSELERLTYLRHQFFGQPSRPSGLYHRQAHYPENVRWWHAGILFSTVHLVGTNNGRDQIHQDDLKTALMKVEARDTANQWWIEKGFEEARIYDAKAIVFIFQADISESNHKGNCTATNPVKCDGLKLQRDQFIRESAEFLDRDQRQKPVLLIHGDTFPFCLDQTIGGNEAPNLWRLNAWGDFQQPSDATIIQVQLDQPNQPFAVQTLIHQTPPERSCKS